MFGNKEKVVTNLRVTNALFTNVGLPYYTFHAPISFLHHTYIFLSMYPSVFLARCLHRIFPNSLHTYYRMKDLQVYGEVVRSDGPAMTWGMHAIGDVTVNHYTF